MSRNWGHTLISKIGVCPQFKIGVCPQFKPLFGRSILLTRPLPEAYDTGDTLELLGASVDIKPMIRVVRRSITRKQLERSLDSDVIIFTSQNGASIYMEGFLEHYDVRRLAGIKFGVIGGQTASVLRSYGIRPSIMPRNFTTDEFGRLLRQKLGKGTAVFYPCADRHNKDFVKKLESSGIKVSKFIAYSIKKVKYRTLNPRQYDFIIFSSSMCVESFFDNLRGKRGGLNAVKFICIGPVTAKKLRGYGYKPLIPDKILFSGVLELILDYV